MLIAATAIKRNLTLVTVDSDFERVTGLDYMLILLRGGAGACRQLLRLKYCRRTLTLTLSAID